jgi:ribonuclease P protein component
VVPRFQFTAVARNRLRRRLKEILRRHLGSLPAVDLVVRAKRAAYAASFAILRSDLSEGVTHVA